MTIGQDQLPTLDELINKLLCEEHQCEFKLSKCKKDEALMLWSGRFNNFGKDHNGPSNTFKKNQGGQHQEQNWKRGTYCHNSG